MQTILSIIILGLLAYWIRKIYFTREESFRRLRYKSSGELYLLSQNMYFTILTVCTAPVYLQGISLFKYALWFLLILYLIFAGKIKMRLEVMTVAYLVFFLWLCYTMTYTTVPTDGMMMLIKYSLPMLFLWLGYSSLRSKTDLIVLLRVLNFVGCVWCLVIGGFAEKFIPPLYYFFTGICFTYAGFADFLVSIFIVPILLYWLTKDKKYIYCALWMILSVVLQSVRTGMGGMLLVFAFAILLKNKWRAVPGLLMAGAVFLGTILYVPSVKKKFFGSDADTITATNMLRGETMSMENMEMSGRKYVWESVMENLYKGNEEFGNGMGVAEYFSKNLLYEDGMAKIHNDYLVLLCDAGIIGVILLSLFYLLVIFKVFYHVALRKSSFMVKLTGLMALPSMAGIAFCMYFDNVVSNSMQSMVMPYIYLGFFLKALDLEKKEERKNGKLAPLQDQRGFEFTFGNYHNYYNNYRY